MSNVWLNRVKFYATTTGTADFTVGSAATGFQTPAGAGYTNGQTASYVAVSADLTQWECGLGTYSTTGPTWQRTTVRQSSNSGSKVSFTAAPLVFVVPLAEDFAAFALGAASSVSGNLPSFADTAGKVLQDSGLAAAYVAMLNAAGQTLSGGARVTTYDNGTKSSGTLTPDPGNGPHQKYTNNGAHTLAPGSNKGSYWIAVTNGASAGAITTSGWTKVTGDSFDTTNAHAFWCMAHIDDTGSLLIVAAAQ